MRNKYFWLLLILILFLAIGLRFYRLGAVPAGLYIDEIAMLVDAKSISQSGLDMHGRPWFQVIYPSYGDYKLPVYIWLAAASVKFFGVTEWALRLPSALAGVGTVLVAGWLARELLDKEAEKIKQIAQLATMLVVAVSPWSMMFSRTGFEGHIGQFLLALSILVALWSRRYRWLILVAPLIGGLATYSYFSVRFVWPVVFLVVAELFLKNWSGDWSQLRHKKVLIQITKEKLAKMVLPLLIFGLTLIPMMKSPLYADSNRFRLSTTSVLNSGEQVIQSNIYRELAGNTVIDRLVFHRWWLIGRELLKNYSDNLSPSFLFITGDPNLRHGTGEHGIYLLAFLPLLLAGLYVAYDRHKSLLVLLVIWWLAALLPASVPDTTPHALRSLNALVPSALLIGLGLSWIINQQVRWLKVVVGLSMVISALSFSYHYFNFYAADSASAWQSGYPQVAKAIFTIHSDQNIIVLPFESRFYLWMMAYGPYTAQDWHSWTSQGFMFREIPSVSFEGLPKTISSGQSIILVGGTDEVAKVVAELQAEVVRKETITSSDKQTKYEVIEIKSRL